MAGLLATPLSLVNPTPDTPDLRDIHERIGRALVQLLALSHRVALTKTPAGDPILTTSDLRLVRPEVLQPDDDAAPTLAQVGPQAANVWAWFRFLNVPESETVVRPDGVAEGDPGRWVLQHLPEPARCAANRYLQHVEYIAKAADWKHLWERCRGQTPAMFVSLVGDEIEERSQTYAYHKVVASYRVRIISANWLGGVSAQFTPPDGSTDPGTQRIVGDARRVLIFENTLQGVLGVVKVTLGAMRTDESRGAERVITDAFDLKVVAYTHTPNSPCEVAYPWQMWLQFQDELGRNAGPALQVPGAA